MLPRSPGAIIEYERSCIKMLTLIETNGLCKQYGGVLRVNRLDLRVPEGAVYGFLGPNGT